MFADLALLQTVRFGELPNGLPVFPRAQAEHQLSPRPFPSAVRPDGTSRSCPAVPPCHLSCARGAAPLAPSAPSPRSSPARYPTDWPSFPPAVGCVRRPAPELLPASADPSTASRLDELIRPRLYAASPPSRPWAAPSAPPDFLPRPWPQAASQRAALQSGMVSS